MEQVLASFGISLKELQENHVKLDGDFPQIWVDRPWHQLTKQEIYALILVSSRLGFTLPQLVLEKIAFWIQLIELCDDFRTKTICLQLTSTCLVLPVFAKALTKAQPIIRQYLYILKSGQGTIRLETVSDGQLDSNLYDKNSQDEFLNWKLSGMRPQELLEVEQELELFIERKDRYRIPMVVPRFYYQQFLNKLREK